MRPNLSHKMAQHQQKTNVCVSSSVKQEVLKEVMGMLVSYKVVVKMMASG